MRYSKSAMPQLTRAAIIHERFDRFFRWPYQANVIKILLQHKSKAVVIIVVIKSPQFILDFRLKTLDFSLRSVVWGLRSYFHFERKIKKTPINMPHSANALRDN